MNYQSLVPSRELCEELEKAGLCQDGAELFFNNYAIVKEWPEWKLEESNHHFSDTVIAPTLPRLMNEFKLLGGKAIIKLLMAIMDWLDDKDTLPNCLANALLAVKKG